MPKNNFGSVLFGSLGAGLGGLPDILRQQSEAKNAQLLQSWQMAMKERDTGEQKKYNEFMKNLESMKFEMMRAEHEALMQREMMQLQSKLADRWMPEQPKPLHPLDEENKRLSNEKLRRENEQIGKESGKTMPPNLAVESRELAGKEQSRTGAPVAPVDMFNRDLAPMMLSYQNKYPQSFGPQAADSIRAMLTGQQWPPPPPPAPPPPPGPQRSYRDMSDEELKALYLQRYGK